MRTPEAHHCDGLPGAVSVYEVGPRDGLQNEPVILPLQVRAEFIRRLVDAGLRAVEATSFVSPKWVPQMADAEAIVGALPGAGAPRFPVLVPNMTGYERARAAGVEAIAVFAAATESFSRRNLNRSLDEALEMFRPVVEAARSDGLWVRAYLSMCFGDPWEGAVSVERVADVAARLFAFGCDELSVADTVGVATPGHVKEVLAAVAGKGIPVSKLAVHFHDTYGQALSNTLAALEFGVTTVDSSAGGLGGCPYADSATGNLATEDLVWMLHGLGLQTGIDLESLVATSSWMARHLSRPSPSRVVRAMARE